MIDPLRLIGYFLWVFKEVVVGSMTMTQALVTRRGYSQPMIVQVPLRCTTDLEITMFASSITITPGTLVVAIAAGDGADDPPTLFVHALFADSEADALDGLYDMETRLLTAMRRRPPKPVSDRILRGAEGAEEGETA